MMILADLARCALVGAMCAVAALGGSIWIVLALAVAASIAATPFAPAQGALLPALVETPAELTAANAVMNTISSVGMFAGPALAGVLVAASGSAAVFGVTAATFLWSALCLAGVPRDERPASDGPPGSVGHELLEGVRAVARVPALRLVVGLTAAQTLVAGLFEVLLVVVAFRLLGSGSSAVGWLNAAVGIGGVAGVVAVAALAGRKRLAGDLGLGVLLWGAPIALVAAWSNLPFALLLFGLVGLGNTIVDVAGMTLLQRSADDQVLGRVFGILESIVLATIAVGALAAPGIVSLLGAKAALVLTGAFLPLLLVPLWPSLRRVDASARVPAEPLSLLRAISIFAPLPPVALERLALAAKEFHVPPSAAVVTQGEAGDLFFVVAEGEAEVIVDGTTHGRLGRGGFFGEIALLHDVPRTASVRALTPLRLYAVERDEFIATVTGHAPSREAAERVVAARLPAAV